MKYLILFFLLFVPRIYVVHAQARVSLIPTEIPVETKIEAIPTDLKAYVIQEAKDYGINPDLAVCIVSHESQWIPDKVGPEVKGKSQGLWQIYNLAHPNITQAEAFDPIWSTNWALTQIKEGHINWWSTYSAPPYYCKNISLFT